MNTGVKPVHKLLVRNIEVPKKNSNLVIKHGTTAECSKNRYSVNFNTNHDFNASLKDDNKFKKPELNSCLGFAKKIDEIKAVKRNVINEVSDLTPNSKKLVKTEITKKLNFANDKQIYKGLIPLNVNDSILIPEKKKSYRTKYTPKFQTKDLEPNLEDFLEPIEPIKLKVSPFKDSDVFQQHNDFFKYVRNLHDTYDSEN